MPGCPTLSATGVGGIADALRAVDCAAGETVANGFSRLFGSGSGLQSALTILLTLYVALFALQLLLGQARLGLPLLSARMLTLGLVLTFATSWTAYQTVVWNLLSAAPDSLAALLLGTEGSATQAFASRLDALFRITGSLAAQSAAAAQVPGTTVGGFTARPGDLLWLSGVLLLLGTAGVLIVTRIALAATLAVGPLFLVLALFRPTRDLFIGWLRVAVQLALAPLLAVLLGSALLQLVQPLIAGMVAAGGKVTLAQATALFVTAFVHAVLMALSLRAAGALAAALRTPDAGFTSIQLTGVPSGAAPGPMASLAGATLSAGAAAAAPAGTDDRRDYIGGTDRRARTVTTAMIELAPAERSASAPDPRLRPLGQRFRPARAR